ncbi:MAG: hypothetical protein AAGB02_07085 [Pseudomonadota bacterium]
MGAFVYFFISAIASPDIGFFAGVLRFLQITAIIAVIVILTRFFRAAQRVNLRNRLIAVFAAISLAAMAGYVVGGLAKGLLSYECRNMLEGLPSKCLKPF